MSDVFKLLTEFYFQDNLYELIKIRNFKNSTPDEIVNSRKLLNAN
jgi:hypothetical protein